ncbi:hypothetical protein GE21DRAFT_1044388 [Neurospora crassa]|nr:hypothetical protein GE21DRAFT_1044388 [Neurospora crassa]
MVPSSCRPFTSLLCILVFDVDIPPRQLQYQGNTTPRSYSPLPLLLLLLYYPSIRSCYARSKAQLLPCVLGTLVLQAWGLCSSPPNAVITSHNRFLQGFWRLARAWLV